MEIFLFVFRGIFLIIEIKRVQNVEGMVTEKNYSNFVKIKYRWMLKYQSRYRDLIEKYFSEIVYLFFILQVIDMYKMFIFFF